MSAIRHGCKYLMGIVDHTGRKNYCKHVWTTDVLQPPTSLLMGCPEDCANYATRDMWATADPSKREGRMP